MDGIQLTEYDKKVYQDQLAAFLPAQMIDAHVHIWLEDMLRTRPEERRGCVSWPMAVASSCSVEDLLLTYAQLFPGKSVKPVLMTSPTVDLAAGNAYALACAQQRQLPVLYCTRHDTPVGEIRQALTVGGFCGVKPYQNHAPAYIPASEVRVYDFLTPDQLALIDELGGIVMLHIARADRLRDPLNIAQMLEIDARYPRAKVIIAHIGRAYSPEDIGDAFTQLRHTRNLVFDFAANTLDTAMEACLQAVGPRRLLFGSDMPITKMRMYRITENGRYINVVPRGLYSGIAGDPNMRETDEPDITTFIYEELLAFKRCADKLELSRPEIEDILCHNAARLFQIAL